MVTTVLIRLLILTTVLIVDYSVNNITNINNSVNGRLPRTAPSLRIPHVWRIRNISIPHEEYS